MSTLPQAAGRRTATAVRTAVTAYALRRPVLLSSLACLLSFAAFWAAQRAAQVSMIDLLVYRAEGWAVRDGQDLYAMRATHAQLPTTYPPFAALLFLPLTLLGEPALRTLATAGNLALLVALVHFALRLTGRPLRLPRPAATLLLSALAVWCEPVWTTLRYGQVNLLLAVLVLWDLSRRAGHRWAGAGIGIAAGIKLTPALFAVFLALYGTVLGARRMRYGDGARGADAPGPGIKALWNAPLRQSAVAALAFLGTVLVSAVLLPGDSRRFWTDAVFRSDRVGHTVITDNQALSGVLARLLHVQHPGAAWVLAAALVLVAGLGAAVAAALAGHRGMPHARAWSALACAVTALLVSPISWSHHWVWCVPLLLLLGAEALRRGSAPWWAGTAVAGVLFCSYALWWVPHRPGVELPPELHQNAGQMALSAVYPLLGAGFLLLTAVVSVRALRGGTAEGPPHRGNAPSPARGAQAVTNE